MESHMAPGQSQSQHSQSQSLPQSFDFSHPSSSSLVDRPYGGVGLLGHASDSSRLSLGGGGDDDEEDEFAGEVSGIVGRPSAVQASYAAAPYHHSSASAAATAYAPAHTTEANIGAWLPPLSYSPSPAESYPAAQSVPSGAALVQGTRSLYPSSSYGSGGSGGGAAGHASPTAGGSMDALQRQLMDMQQQQQLQHQHAAYLQQLEQQQQMQRLLQQQQHIQQQQQQLYLQQQQLHLLQPQIVPAPQPPPPPIVPAAPFPPLSPPPALPPPGSSSPASSMVFASGAGDLGLGSALSLHPPGQQKQAHESASHTPSRKRSRVGSISHGLGGPSMPRMPERPFSAAASFRSLEPDNRAEHADRQAAYLRMYQQQQAAAKEQQGPDDDDLQQMLKRCRSASPIAPSQQMPRSMTHSYSAMAAAAAALTPSPTPAQPSASASASASGAAAPASGADGASADPSLKRPTMHRRRRTEELLPHETWQCPYSDPATSLPCGKTYRTSSSRSIHKHAQHCPFKPAAGSASAEALNQEKRRKQKKRRKSYELAAHERWNCPHGCGRFFRTTSTKSIHLHRLTCSQRTGGPVQPDHEDITAGDEQLHAKLTAKEHAKLARARNRQLKGGGGSGTGSSAPSPSTPSVGAGAHPKPSLRIQLNAPSLSHGSSQAQTVLSSPTAGAAATSGAGTRSRLKNEHRRFSSASDSSLSSSDSEGDERDDADLDDDEEREERKLKREEEEEVHKRQQSPLDPQLQEQDTPLQLSSHVVDAVDLPPASPLPESSLLPITPPIRRMSFDDLYPSAPPSARADAATTRILGASPTHDHLSLAVLPVVRDISTTSLGTSHDLMARLQRDSDRMAQQQHQHHEHQQAPLPVDDGDSLLQSHLHMAQLSNSRSLSALPSPAFLPATLFPAPVPQQSSDSGTSSTASLADLTAASTAQRIQNIQSQLRLIQHMQKQAQSDGAVSASNVDAMQKLHDSIEMATQQLAADQQQQYALAQQQQHQQQQYRSQTAAAALSSSSSSSTSAQSDGLLRMLMHRPQESDSRLDSGGSNSSGLLTAAVHPHDLSRPSSSASMRELASDMSQLHWASGPAPAQQQQQSQPQSHVNQLSSYQPIYTGHSSLNSYSGLNGSGSSSSSTYASDGGSGALSRRLPAQLPDRDRWTCTNHACGKFFHKSATNAIRHHALSCASAQQSSSASDVSSPFSPSTALQLIAAGMPAGHAPVGGAPGRLLSVDLDDDAQVLVDDGADDADNDITDAHLQPHAIDQQMFPTSFDHADAEGLTWSATR